MSVGDHNLHYKSNMDILPDPGNGGTIRAAHSANCAMTVAAGTSETRTLSSPAFLHQRLLLTIKSLGDGGGVNVTTSDTTNGLSASAGTVVTSAAFSYDDDFLSLVAHDVDGTLAWRTSGATAGLPLFA